MRTVAAAALLALRFAAASPIAAPVAAPQDAGFLAEAYGEVADDIADPVTVPSDGNVAVQTVAAYNPTTVITAAVADATSGGLERRRALEKRGPCDPYPPGYGPVVTSPADDDTSFLNYSPFASAANSASTPNGYKKVFTDLTSSVSAGSYMGYNGSFTTYDIQGCANQCDAIKGCVSFNMFYERNPTLDATDSSGACPNPPSLTRIKCSFWGVPVTSSDATNNGQWQGEFHVVIAGSNAYSNVPDTPSGYTGTTFLQNAAIQAPSGDDSYMGIQTFPNSPYDPQVCADACNAKSQYNIDHHDAGTDPRICRFFNAYMLYQNWQSPVFTCIYFTTAWDSSHATNTGQYDSQGNHYTMAHSYSFTLSS